MKKLFTGIITLVVTGLPLSVVTAQSSQTKPEPFLPEITSGFPVVRDICLNGNGTEAWFTAQSLLGEVSVIMHTRLLNGDWQKPEVAGFSGLFNDLEPFLTHDGLRLYFASDRPVHPSVQKSKDFDIWYVERSALSAPWSEPKNPGSPVNSDANEFYPSLASSQNLYFTSDGPGSKGKDDIFYCRWNGVKYEPPVPLGDSVNSEGYEFNAYIASDESWILYTCYNRKDGMGSGDLYISYHLGNNRWTAPINAGASINSQQMDYCPWMDESNGWLYFTSKRSFIRKPSDVPFNAFSLQNVFSQHENGQSRLYRVRFLPKD